MTNRLTLCLLAGFLAGQASAQQAAWSPSQASYVPLWVVPAPVQPVPPPYLLPQRVPFPMPFWMWFAPPPGMPWAIPVPPTGVQAAAGPPARLEAPAPTGMPAAGAPPAVTPAPVKPDLPAPVPSDAAPPVEKSVAVPAVQPEVVASTAAAKPDPAKVEAARETTGAPAQLPTKVPVKPVETPKAKTPAPKTERTTPKRTGAPVNAKVVPAPAKPAGKTRKLCWKDGRLDVCE